MEENSEREKLILCYVDEFLINFKERYPERKLDIKVRNEHGVLKFISSFIRPSSALIKDTDLYYLKYCTRFVSNMIQAKHVDKFEGKITSGPTLLKERTGNCYDASFLLCSLLRGVGYNSFCAFGKIKSRILDFQTALQDVNEVAVKDIFCLDDESGKSWDKNETLETKTNFEPLKLEASSLLKPKYEAFELESRFDKPHVEEKNEVSFNEKYESIVPIVEGEIGETFQSYCWVLVKKGERGLEENIFIEPILGLRYTEIQWKEYFKDIDFVVNENNVYFTMEPDVLDEFNLDNEKLWGKVFVEPEKMSAIKRKEKATKDSLVENRSNVFNKRILSVPPSDLCDLAELIDRKTDHLKYKQFGKMMVRLGKQCLTFMDMTKSNLDNAYLVCEKFLDSESLLPVYRRSYYKNRKDHLIERTVQLMLNEDAEEEMIEIFAKTRTDGVQKLRQVAGLRRTIAYFPTRKPKGEIYREENFTKNIITINYENRPDLLIKRTIKLCRDSFSKTTNTQKARRRGSTLLSQRKDFQFNPVLHQKYQGREAEIYSIEDEYQKAPNKRKLDTFGFVLEETEVPSVKLVEYLIKDGLIRITMHLKCGNFIQTVKTFSKDDLAEETHDGSRETENHLLDISLAEGEHMLSARQYTTELESWVRKEKDAFNEIREAERETQELFFCRIHEEKELQNKVELSRKANVTTLENTSRMNEHSKVKNPKNCVDELSLYLKEIDLDKISFEDATAAREKCLDDLKQRLLLRARLIEDRLIDEKERFATRKAAYERSKEQGDDSKSKSLQSSTITKSLSSENEELNISKGSSMGEENFEVYKEAAEFRIRILERRLQQHEKESLKRFTKLEEKLRADPRLSILFKK
eukprot:snap_masked-scaffold_8-processed-gene-13.28-mRNA-1 protein AED:1.00 eAED:1.00 QI:0/-1/0/0/-1/1/1/0/865